jgi:uncharacterized membrane protein YgcG
MRFFILFFIMVVSSDIALGTNLKFIGKGTYTVNSSATSVKVDFDELSNQDGNIISGTIYLQLWASPDNDPTGSGYSLTEPQSLAQFNGAGDGRLEPNASFVNISFNAPYNPPPTGTYYVFLLALEYPDLESYVDSVPATDNPSFLSNPRSGGGGGDGGGGGIELPPPGSGGGSNQSAIDLVCDPCRYELNDGFMDLYVSQIINNRAAGISGTLRLTVWATDTPYRGSALSGYQLLDARLGELNAQTRLYDVKRSLAIIPPPDGTYYMNLFLEEYDGLSYQVIDYITFDDLQSFSPVALAPPPFSSGGGGGSGAGGGGADVGGSGSSGGGGSFDVTTVAGLLFLLVCYQICLLGIRKRFRAN